MKHLTIRDRIEHGSTLIIALLLIYFGMPLVVTVNNQLFAVWCALLIGVWLQFMYRKAL